MNVFAGTFSGGTTGGDWFDTSKWSGSKVPYQSDGQNNYIKGLCYSTNATEVINGGSWFHIGAGGADGILDVFNGHAQFDKEFRHACSGGSGYYHQKGGSLSFYNMTIGYAAGYKDARILLENVAATNGYKFAVGSTKGADGSAKNARFEMAGGNFKKKAGNTTINNGATVSFDNCKVDYYGQIYIYDGLFSVVNCVYTNSSEYGLMAGSQSGKTGTIAFTNSIVYTGKSTLATASGGLGILEFVNSSWTHKHQLYVGNTENATGIVRVVNSELTTVSQYKPEIGSGAGSYGEVQFLGANTKVEDFNKFGWNIANGARSTGRIVWDGVNWADARLYGYTVGAGADSTSFLEFRNISGSWTFPLAVPKAGSKMGVTVFDNAHYKIENSYALATTQYTTNHINVVNNGSFTWNYDGVSWLPNSEGIETVFNLTNAASFQINATSGINHVKEGAALRFNVHDSVAHIATNSTLSFGHGVNSFSELRISGDSHVLSSVIDCSANGRSEFNLNGGVFEVEKVGGASAVFNFNGGTLKARAATTQISNAAIECNVCEGGAVFDTASYTVTLGNRMLHAGAADKDGGIVKKGEGTLKLTATGGHTFNGDIVVEEGTLDISAAGAVELSQGQRIGGAGVMVVGEGITAGGIVSKTGCGALRVDGDVAFAPGATVYVEGLTSANTGSPRIRLLTADSISGAANLSYDELPASWKIVCTSTTVDLVPISGTMLLVL